MLAATLLTPLQLVLGAVFFGAAALWALARVSWVELLADDRRQHLFFGSIFALFVLWLVRRDFDNGLTFHFLGLTAVTLLLDWPLAVVAGSLAQLGLVLLGMDDAEAFGVNGILRVLVPVIVTLVISRALELLKPRNLFAYIFVSGFFAAALAAAATILVGIGMLTWSGQLSPPSSLMEAFGYLLLVAFPEAFINGTAISALVVFCPDWLETFDTDRYLQEPFDEK
ncbi:energy-coupling factor ABC transporter permease [Halopseudomonas sp.]|uniref:energy-coupling factor ABC transporter permease n=1 Tax=Halopseudomonas sp. TaxID=2901191 RepID=UPI003561E006